MSIAQVNKLFQNKGCNIAVSAVLGLAVISMLGWGSRGCGATSNSNQQVEEKALTIVKSGDLNVTRSMVERRDQQQQDDLPGAARFQQQAQMVENLVYNGLALKMAKSEGITFTDDEIRKRQIDQATDQMRQQMMMSGKLSFSATEQEFEAAYKALTGRSFADDRKNIESTVNDALKDPNSRAQMEAELALPALVEHDKAKYAPKEDDVKKQFDMYHFKVIMVEPTSAGKEGPAAKAQAILKEIKGGLSFDAAMDKYPAGPTEKGKKPHEAKPLDLSVDTLEGMDSLKPLLRLKPGDVSDVITIGSVARIFKFIDHKLDLPKDYDKQKPTLIDNKAKSLAAKAISEQVKKLDTPENVKWENKGYELLHNYMKLQEPDTASAPDKSKKLREIVEQGLKLASDPMAGDAAVAAAKLAETEASAGLPASEAQKLRADVLTAYVDRFPEPDARVDLAETYVNLGNAEKAAETIREAADVNSGHVDDQGKANWEKLLRLQKTAESKKLLNTEDSAFVTKTYQDWLKEYNDQKKAEQDLEAERRKVQQELEKAGKNNAPSTGTKPGSNTPKSPAKPVTGKPAAKP